MTPIDQIRKALGFEVTSDTPRILEWADQAGCRPATDSECALWDALHAAVQRAAEMQERCAQVADGYAQIDGTQIAADDYDRGWMRGASRIAAAIRAIKE